jgi:hypothetical protein
MADKYSAGRYCFFGGLGLAVAILFAPDSVPALAIRIRRKADEARDLVRAKARRRAVCSQNLMRIAMIHIQRLAVTYESDTMNLSSRLLQTKDSCLN